MRTDRWILAGLVLAALPLGAAAQGMPSATSEQPMRDPWVPPAWSIGVAEVLRARGLAVELTTLPGAGHVPIDQHDLFLDGTEAFLATHLAPPES